MNLNFQDRGAIVYDQVNSKSEREMGIKRRKSVSMQTVADHVGVSLATVSMALSNHPNVADGTRSRVLQACKELDYNVPTGRPSGGRSAVKRMGLAFMGERREDEMAALLINWVMRAADEHGISVQVAALENANDDAAVLTFLRRQAREVDALLVTGWAKASQMDALQDEDCQIILYGNALYETAVTRPGPPPCHQLIYDDQASARFATEWLLQRGHRVGFVSEQVPPGLTHDRNLDGYILALHKHGSAFDPRLVQTAGRAGGTGPEAAKLFAAMESGPTAYVIPDARTAFAFISAMREYGHEVPPDAVVLSCHESRRQLYMVEACPCYCPDMEATAEALFGLMENRGALPEPLSIRLPHVYYNFD